MFLVNRVFFYMLCLMFVCSTSLSSQTQLKQIIIQKRELPNQIKLKWNITHKRDWKKVIHSGFVLERKAIRYKGKLLMNSQIEVLDTLVVADQSQWLRFDPKKRKYIAILSQALFGNNFNVATQNSNFVEQINAQRDEKEQRFSIGNLAMSSDFDAALLAGSAYIDSTVRPHYEYIYRVSSLYAPKDQRFQNIILASVQGYRPLGSPQNIEGVFQENTVELSWPVGFSHSPFIAYEIEVSRNGSSFTKIHKNLIVPDVDQKLPEFMKKGGYSYTYPNNQIDQTYSVRYRAMTDFAEWSPYSKPITGNPIHKLEVNPTLFNTSQHIENKGFTLKWGFPISEIYRVKEIKLEFSTDIYNPYQSILDINKLTVTKDTTLSILRGNQLISGYYRVRCIGYHGENTYSMPQKVNMPNTIPPARPSRLRANLQQTEHGKRVSLSWNANTESDLKGYRVYKSTSKDGDYHLADNLRFFEETHFEEWVTSGYSTLYYKIKAVDVHYNHSKFSRPVEVVIKPSEDRFPIKLLEKIINKTNITIRFRIPTEGDMPKRFTLYRKVGKSNHSQLVEAFELNKNQNELEFSDQYIQEGQYYAYYGISTYDNGDESEKLRFPLMYVPITSVQSDVPFKYSVEETKQGYFKVVFTEDKSFDGKVYIYHNRGGQKQMIFSFTDLFSSKTMIYKDNKIGDTYQMFIHVEGKKYPLVEL